AQPPRRSRLPGRPARPASPPPRLDAAQPGSRPRLGRAHIDRLVRRRIRLGSWAVPILRRSARLGMGMIRLARREARLKLGKIRLDWVALRLAVWIVRLARGASVNRPSECSEAEKKESMVEQIR